jgi:hypothetical protein
VLVQDLICVIFEDMDPIWLRSMWEILISLALFKLLSIACDLLILLRTMLMYCYFGVASIFLMLV